MQNKARLAVYLAAGLALVAVFLFAPGAWAEPLQNRLGQTVPTMTPTGAAVPPTAAPATPRPGATAAPPTDTPPNQPPPAGVTATPAAAVAGSPLSLAMTVSQANVWPGAQVVFTLTLTNTSAASVRQVRLENVLPEGLEPGAVQGGEATWDGRTLRVERAVLPPSGRLTVVFTAGVAREVPASGVIINQAVATAGPAARPSTRVTASVALTLPPLELPPTGGSRGYSASLR